jgi:hypothetical protein
VKMTTSDPAAEVAARPMTHHKGGRPTGVVGLRSRAARHVDAAVAALADVASDPRAPAAARVDAAVALLDAARPPLKA